MALDVPPGTPDRGPGLVVMCVFFMVLVTISTGARIASKFVVKQAWWWDDYFALIAWVSRSLCHHLEREVGLTIS